MEWYCLRWRTEDWYWVLKSGCQIEELGHESAERLGRAIAINAVIAWRIMLMALLGREVPDLPPDVLFSDLEIEVLRAYANRRGDLTAPTSLKSAVWIVAAMGGYLRRKSDPPPGQARELLAPVHAAFTEGLGTLDVRSAGRVAGGAPGGRLRLKGGSLGGAPGTATSVSAPGRFGDARHHALRVGGAGHGSARWQRPRSR